MQRGKAAVGRLLCWRQVEVGGCVSEGMGSTVQLGATKGEENVATLQI